jgi:hypothetical protein
MKHCKYLSFCKKKNIRKDTQEFVLTLMKQIKKGKHIYEVLLETVYGPNSLQPGQRRSFSVPQLALAALTSPLTIWVGHSPLTFSSALKSPSRVFSFKIIFHLFF